MSFTHSASTAKHANDIQARNLSDTISPASSQDLDETYEIYKQKEDAHDIDPAQARQVLSKIDLHILPLLMGTYMLQCLDKSSINFASVYGLEEGTNLEGQDYSWLSSIFYIGRSGEQSSPQLVIC